MQGVIILYDSLRIFAGDIGEMSPDGVLKIIDRKKNMFKLSQGEYVASEHLEKVYCFAPILEDVSLLNLRLYVVHCYDS